MGRNSCRLEMALPAPVQPPNWLGAAPLAGLRVQATGGVGPAQVARRPPGARAGREAAAAGWGGSGPAASSCSPPAWGSAGRAGRSEVRAPTPLPRPFPGRPRADSARRGWVASRAEGAAGRGPLCPGGWSRGDPDFQAVLSLPSGARGRRLLRPAQRRRRRGGKPPSPRSAGPGPSDPSQAREAPGGPWSAGSRFHSPCPGCAPTSRMKDSCYLPLRFFSVLLPGPVRGSGAHVTVTAWGPYPRVRNPSVGGLLFPMTLFVFA